MMEVTNVNILRWNKIQSLTINFHDVFSSVMMENPALFTNFMRNILGVTAHQTINIIKNSVESFGDLLAVNDRDIDTFVKYTQYLNNNRVTAQIILISNSVNQELKSMLFEL